MVGGMVTFYGNCSPKLMPHCGHRSALNVGVTTSVSLNPQRGHVTRRAETKELVPITTAIATAHM
jgi:hypothetical protein